MQNADGWPAYSEAIQIGRLALSRAYRPTDDERLIREVILQLKKGAIAPAYFAGKFGVDVRDRFAPVWRSLADDSYLAENSADRVALTADGLSRVDMLLHRFFLPQHVGVRYT